MSARFRWDWASRGRRKLSIQSGLALTITVPDHTFDIEYAATMALLFLGKRILGAIDVHVRQLATSLLFAAIEAASPGQGPLSRCRAHWDGADRYDGCEPGFLLLKLTLDPVERILLALPEGRRKTQS